MLTLCKIKIKIIQGAPEGNEKYWLEWFADYGISGSLPISNPVAKLGILVNIINKQIVIDRLKHSIRG
jgi:hypothetical protein